MLTWDPDVIFLLSSNKQLLDEFMADASFQELTAEKNNRVYAMPAGLGFWGTPTPDNELMVQWMASMLHPEDYKDVDMVKIVQDFYTQFYGVTLTRENMETRLQGVDPDAE